MRTRTALSFLALAAVMAPSRAQADETEDAVRAVADRFVAAWTAIDRETAKALLAEDVDLVEPDGVKTIGRGPVLNRTVRGAGGPKIVVRLVSYDARTVTADVAVADWTLTFVAQGVEMKASPTHAIVVSRKGSGGWQIAAIRLDRDAARSGGRSDDEGPNERGRGKEPGFGPKDALRAERTKSADNLRSLVLVLLSGDVGIGRPFPALSGKRFVLWPVAKGLMKPDAALTLLFSPRDGTRSVERAGGPAAFEALTMEALRDEKTDVDRFTSYVGRLNGSREHVLTPTELEAGAAILADLSFPDGAIVAFTNGSVKWLSREDLGIPAGHPIVAGPESESEILRHLGP